MKEKLAPSVNYLQRLGPDYLELIFEYSRWVFEQDTDIAFEVSFGLSCLVFTKERG